MRIKKLCVQANSLLHCLQDYVWAHNIELEDRGPEPLHKVPNGLGSPHPDVEKTSKALLRPDQAHILSDELLKQASKEVTVLGARRWNHDKAGSTKLVGKTLHSKASFLVCSVIFWRKHIR